MLITNNETMLITRNLGNVVAFVVVDYYLRKRQTRLCFTQILIQYDLQFVHTCIGYD